MMKNRMRRGSMLSIDLTIYVRSFVRSWQMHMKNPLIKFLEIRFVADWTKVCDAGHFMLCFSQNEK